MGNFTFNADGTATETTPVMPGAFQYFAVIDIGSPAKGNLGWAVVGPDLDTAGTDPDVLTATLIDIINRGGLFLGFEAPMFVPAGRTTERLLKARGGEGSRPWSVAAGATVTTTALAVVPWVLDRIGQEVGGVCAWQNWTRLPTSAKEILVFEAFVAGGPSDGHAADAHAAATAARLAFSNGQLPTSALLDEPCFSMLGAALLHAGLTRDLSELHTACLVVKALKMVTETGKALSCQPSKIRLHVDLAKDV